MAGKSSFGSGFAKPNPRAQAATDVLNQIDTQEVQARSPSDILLQSLIEGQTPAGIEPIATQGLSPEERQIAAEKEIAGRSVIQPGMVDEEGQTLTQPTPSEAIQETKARQNVLGMTSAQDLLGDDTSLDPMAVGSRFSQRGYELEETKLKESGKGFIPSNLTRNNVRFWLDNSYAQKPDYPGGFNFDQDGLNTIYELTNAVTEDPDINTPFTRDQDLQGVSFEGILEEQFAPYVQQATDDLSTANRKYNTLLMLMTAALAEGYKTNQIGFSNQDMQTQMQEFAGEGNVYSPENFMETIRSDEETLSLFQLREKLGLSDKEAKDITNPKDLLQQDPRGLIPEEERPLGVYDADVTPTRGTYEGRADVGEIKFRIFDENDNPESYRHINDFTKGLVRRAKKMLIGPNANVEVNNDIGQDALLGEYILQKAIEEKVLGIYSYRDSRSGKLFYYVDLVNPDNNPAITAHKMSTIIDPTQEITKLGQPTPTTPVGEVGNFQYSKTKDSVLFEGDKVPLDQYVLSLMGGVGRVVDERIMTLLDLLMSNVQSELSREYFKLDSRQVEKTKRNAFKRRFSQLRRMTDLSPEEISELAKEYAQQEAEKALSISLQKKATEIGLLKNRLADTDTEGRQKIKYAEWLISEINNRFQERSRDMQSADKDTTRMADNFAEKARIKVSINDTIETLAQAKKLRNTLFVSDVVSKNGRKALKEWQNNYTAFERQEIAAKIMWATTYIKLMQDSKMAIAEHTYFNGEKIRPNLKRMTPDEVLKYYADHDSDNGENLILAKLAEYGNEVNTWIETKQLPEFQMGEVIQENTKPVKDWRVTVFDRGEMGYYITNLLDAKKYMDAKKQLANSGNPDGSVYIELSGIQEMDSNNSNIMIQALQGGNIDAASTLGIAFGKNSYDIKRFYDKFKSADSFYNVLADNYINVILKQFPNDVEKREAMLDFFKEAIQEVGGPKPVTRDIVVSGFYGLWPGVNLGSVEELIAIAPSAYNNLIKKNTFGDEISIKEEILGLQAANFQSILGEISVASDAKKLGVLIAMNGDFSPNFLTQTGAIIKSMLEELTHDYTRTLSHGADLDRIIGSGVKKYIERNGRLEPIVNRRKTIADSQTRFTINVNNEIIDISKKPGYRFADGIAAIYTHTLDAYLEKVALLAQNEGRKVPMPNISIHDANKVNAVSYVDHWIAYNMVAIPEILMYQTDDNPNAPKFDNKPFLLLIADKALKVKNQLDDMANKAIADNKKGGNVKFNIGTDSVNQFRVIQHFFDREYEYLSEEVLETLVADQETEFKGDPLNPYKSSVQRKFDAKGVPSDVRASQENKAKWLQEAAELGWIPSNPDHPKYQSLYDSNDPDKVIRMRQNNSVSPEAFKRLIELAFKIQDFDQSTKGKSVNRIQNRLDTMKNKSLRLGNLVKKGHAILNNQNSG